MVDAPLDGVFPPVEDIEELGADSKMTSSSNVSVEKLKIPESVGDDSSDCMVQPDDYLWRQVVIHLWNRVRGLC